MNEKITVQQHKRLSLFFGILLILLGLFTSNARIFLSAITIYIFGWVLLIGGGAQCFASFYGGRWKNFFVMLITGLISFIIGGAIVVNPHLSSQTIAILVSIVFIVQGLLQIVESISSRTKQWMWDFITGIIFFVLGIVLWFASSLGNIGMIGFVIGIALVISGFLTIINAYTYHTTISKRLA